METSYTATGNDIFFTYIKGKYISDFVVLNQNSYLIELKDDKIIKKISVSFELSTY